MFAIPAVAAAATTVQLSGLTTDNATNPLGIDTARPSLGWRLSATDRGERQTAHQIQVWTDTSTQVWDSGTVPSSASFGVPYGGPALAASTRYHWRVRVWDSVGRASAWSASAWWETGLLTDADWSGARWIGGPASAGLPRWPAGTTVTASSSHAPSTITYAAANAIDANPTTFWNDDTQGAFPDWLTVQTPSPISLRGVTLYSATQGGPSDFTVQTLQSGQWVTQQHSTGIHQTYTQVTFASTVTTTSVRVTVNADWEQDTRYVWTRIGELSPGLVGAPMYGTAAAPLLRTTFHVDKVVRQARLYISGLGYYQAYINGTRVGTSVLDPAFTMYDHRVYYATHDVTGLVTSNVNALGVELGRGFYGLTSDTPWWNWNKASWHHEPQLRVKLVVTYTDGSSNVVTTGDNWTTSSGPRLFDSVYTGEDYDARLAQPGWQQPSFDASRWSAAPIVAAPKGVVQAQPVEPIKVTGTFRATGVTQPTAGVYVFDFGKTTAGWAALSDVVGTAGRQVTMRYGERLNTDGTLMATDNYGGRSLATYTYTFAGGGPESWEPAFSWQSFRYVEVRGLPTAPSTATLVGKAVHTAAPVVGAFSSSNALYNQIHEGTLRTIQNNMQSVLSDTPLYEKNGWMDDATLGSQFIPLDIDVSRFFAKWATDMGDTQVSSGNVSLIAPSNGNGLDVNYPWGPAPEWQAGYLAVTWALYQQYGDARVLADHYDSLVRYANYELGALDSRGLARTSLGDWVAPGATSDPQVTATAFVYRSERTMASIAQTLGRTADAARFNTAADNLRTAFNNAFFQQTKGYYQSPAEPTYRQTTNALPLMFGLVPSAAVRSVADSLAADVANRGNHLATGSLGTSVLLTALSRNGHADTAAKVAAQTTYPSWGYWLRNGGDTLFESWDLNARSRDHLFLGAGVEQWFYEDLAGLRRDGAGWEHMIVAPTVPAGMTSATASVNTIRGTAASSWQKASDGTLTLNVTVPVGATADVRIPTAAASGITESGGPAASAPGVSYTGMVGGTASYRVGSGTYKFVAPR